MSSEVERPPVPLFALIIGIDDYAHRANLGGAVADAEAVKQYLVDTLQVSKDHIIPLYNEEATRNAIIEAFQDLRNNERIKLGDPIVIFYSGHGSKHDAPPSWNLEGKIQYLVPHDCGAPGTEPPPEHAPIPDRTIGALIKAIADEKGDNITVIFDCCFSASGTRAHEEGYTARTVDLDFPIPGTLDDEIWGRAGTITDDFKLHGLRSHVLLAACGESEFAYECKGTKRGRFTTALLETLKTCVAGDLTYAELIKKIPSFKNQHPQCEGSNRHRALFNGKVPAGRQVYYAADRRGGKYVIGAGLAHGISRGAEITLYSDRKRKLAVVPVDETSSVEDFEIAVTTSVPLADVKFAKLTRVGKLPLYVENHSATLETLRCIDGYGTDKQMFRLVGAKEAKLEVEAENGLLVFKVLDERLKSFGLAKLPNEVALNNAAHILGSAAHYYWFLDLAKEHDPTRTECEVAVDFYPLDIEYDDFGLPLISIIEPSFCRKDPKSGNSDVIDFAVDPNAHYGIKITNKTPWDLYLNVFLFNNSDLSIVPCYTQSSAGEAEPPLKKDGEFTIGYGTGGTPPLSYSLQDDQDIDVSYLKIFFATRAVDLSDIALLSPFSNMNARGGADDDIHLRGLKSAVTAVMAVMRLTSKHTWFTLNIPVIQRRQEM